MPTAADPVSDPLELIKSLDVPTIRAKLSRALREAEALRSLLRLAERTAKAREDLHRERSRNDA